MPAVLRFKFISLTMAMTYVVERHYFLSTASTIGRPFISFNSSWTIHIFQGISIIVSASVLHSGMNPEIMKRDTGYDMLNHIRIFHKISEVFQQRGKVPISGPPPHLILVLQVQRLY